MLLAFAVCSSLLEARLSSPALSESKGKSREVCSQVAAGFAALSGVAAGVGRSKTFGTSGKSNSSYSESESDCLCSSGRERDSIVKCDPLSCSSFNGTLEPPPNCFGPS